MAKNFSLKIETTQKSIDAMSSVNTSCDEGSSHSLFNRDLEEETPSIIMSDGNRSNLTLTYAMKKFGISSDGAETLQDCYNHIGTTRPNFNSLESSDKFSQKALDIICESLSPMDEGKKTSFIKIMKREDPFLVSALPTNDNEYMLDLKISEDIDHYIPRKYTPFNENIIEIGFDMLPERMGFTVIPLDLTQIMKARNFTHMEIYGQPTVGLMGYMIMPFISDVSCVDLYAGFKNMFFRFERCIVTDQLVRFLNELKITEFHLVDCMRLESFEISIRSLNRHTLHTFSVLPEGDNIVKYDSSSVTNLEMFSIKTSYIVAVASKADKKSCSPYVVGYNTIKDIQFTGSNNEVSLEQLYMETHQQDWEWIAGTNRGNENARFNGWLSVFYRIQMCLQITTIPTYFNDSWHRIPEDYLVNLTPYQLHIDNLWMSATFEDFAHQNGMNGYNEYDIFHSLISDDVILYPRLQASIIDHFHRLSPQNVILSSTAAINLGLVLPRPQLLPQNELINLSIKDQWWRDQNEDFPYAPHHKLVVNMYDPGYGRGMDISDYCLNTFRVRSCRSPIRFIIMFESQCCFESSFNPSKKGCKFITEMKRGSNVDLARIIGEDIDEHFVEIPKDYRFFRMRKSSKVLIIFQYDGSKPHPDHWFDVNNLRKVKDFRDFMDNVANKVIDNLSLLNKASDETATKIQQIIDEKNTGRRWFHFWRIFG
jgi:hypothetical protein